MEKTGREQTLMILHVSAHVLSVIITSFFRARNEWITYSFQGYRAISAIFPDPVLAAYIAKRLNKQVDTEILAGELLLITKVEIYTCGDQAMVADLTGIGFLGNLKKLIIYRSNIEVLVPEMQHLHKLETLDLSEGNIQEIPSHIFQLTALQKLTIRRQNLSRLSSSIRSHSDLEVLDISENNLNFLPNELGMLTELRQLYLQRNPLEALPNELSYLHKLETLDVSYTNINQIPTSLSQLEMLNYINVFHTEVEGTEILFSAPRSTDLKIVSNQGIKLHLPRSLERGIDARQRFAQVGMLTLAIATIIVLRSMLVKQKRT